jgi:ABC-type amino acid transport substrate-binding protein
MLLCMRQIMRSLLAFAIVAAFAADAAPQNLRVCARRGPFFFSKEGRPSGFEHDLLSGFAGATGRQLEVVWVDSFDGVFPLIENGSCEIAAARITVTQDRVEKVDFSAPYFPVMVVLVTRAKSDIATAEQLVGKTVMVRKGTVQENILHGSSGKITIAYAKSDKEMFAAVAQGTADALLCDSAVVLRGLAQNPGLRVAASFSEKEHYGFALKKGSPLTSQLNSYLQKIVDDGTYGRFMKLRFGELADMILANSGSIQK